MINTTQKHKFDFLVLLLLFSSSIVYAASFTALTLPTNNDPCEVLIGVETYGDCDGELGAFVSGVIDGSIAAAYGIQPGDIIVGMDNIHIDTPDDLVAARNQYQPGAQFMLYFIRAGKLNAAKMQFRACSREAAAPVATIEVGLVPNPTQGPIQLTLPASNSATVVAIHSIAGNQVYQKIFPASSAAVTETVQLGTTAGVYMVSVVQGASTITKKVVVLPLN